MAEEEGPIRQPNRKLRRQRRLRGWSIDDVAGELCKLAAFLHEPEPGVNGNMVSRWERGVRTPRPRYVRLLCKLFDLPADELGLVEEEVGQPVTNSDGQLDDRYYQLLVCELLGTPAEALGLMEDGTNGPVRRRQFLTYGVGLAGSSALDLEGLAAVLNRLHQVDAPRLSELRVLATKLEQDYDTTSPRILLPAVRANLARLRTAKSPASDTLTRQLWSLTGEMAVLAGRLSYRLHNIGDAEWYYLLAEQLARECGDEQLRAFALAARSSLYSNIGGDGHTPVAVALLDEADAIAGPGSSPYVRAWLLSSLPQVLSVTDR